MGGLVYVSKDNWYNKKTDFYNKVEWNNNILYFPKNQKAYKIWENQKFQMFIKSTNCIKII